MECCQLDQGMGAQVGAVAGHSLLLVVQVSPGLYLFAGIERRQYGIDGKVRPHG